ncbi:pyridoxal-phosphate dependent enzyme [Candidatus Formimonas warabiya]|uniref:Pyridoxal-5-phosphate-dependent protein subunit beta n=1 Tax=Formimonas warabiya TaxID=1761012 RepID=A0A3G1KQX9_FORW1|nr:pyridoxal-phosphate dependent enzyme [Candidatus Formimonas warabiya]ATW24837.1 pyridoxal-5-phosphate-dependent protein subunit beta [Candidatus Formimonas warabiya]
MIDLTIHEQQLERTVAKARERNIIIPTFKEMKNPELIPEKIKEKLKHIGLWDVNSYNLFRITWKNQPVKEGGLYGDVNYLEFPPELTGVKARIIALVGKWFPTGCHKVGASFGCLVPRLVTGQFDPTFHKAVWPSTGNFCRGGAYNAELLSCQSIAILPQEMSRERFEWLSRLAGEVIATPGCESNVKEIFDKTWELRKTRDNVMIFNQFEELGNYLWHYEVTGHAMEEVLNKIMGAGDRFAGAIFTSGSAGTMACGDYLKEKFPYSKLGVGEALQCPTLLENGFGGHRIEGIGDKHVPWIHNVKNTDLVVAINDENSVGLIRLFNEPAGKKYLVEQQGVAEELVEKLSFLGISGIANVLGAIKLAKYYELTEKDFVVTVLTDSMELYGSRLEELKEKHGEYKEINAAGDYYRHLISLTTDNMQELTYVDRRRVHNLKYYTWVEQQGRELDELNAQWYDYDHYWGSIRKQAEQIDELITEFNQRTGLL